MTFYDDIPEIEPVIDGSDLQIGIVMSRFNLDISEGLLSACIIELRKNGVLDHNILLALCRPEMLWRLEPMVFCQVHHQLQRYL